MIQNQAMLVKLNVRQWSARKLDRNATRKIISEYHANDDAGRFNKLLMDSPALQEIQKIAGATRKDHYELTLPWFDDGSRILPSKMFFDYTAKMSENRGKFDAQVQAFLVEYPELVTSAQKFLGELFSEADYPDVKIIASKFGFETFVYPIPSKFDFRVQALNGEMDKIKRDLEQKVNNQVKEAKKDLWNRLYDAINAIVERLSDPEAIFRDTLITNVDDLSKILVKLNIDNDQRLTDTLSTVEQTILRYAPDSLRTVPALRKQAVDQSKTILQTIERYR